MTCIVFFLNYISYDICFHSRTLASHTLRTRHKILQAQRSLNTNISPHKTEQLTAKLEHYTHLSDHLESAVSVIDINTNLKPFRLFGFIAQYGLTFSIATTGASFYFVCLNLYSQSNGVVTNTISNI